MPTNLLDSLRGLVPHDLITKACGMLGESETATAKAVEAVFPTVLGGLLGKAQDSGSMGQVFDLLKDKANDASILNSVGSLLGGGANQPINTLGEKFLSSIFGEKISSVAGMLSNNAGIKPSSARSLLSMAGLLIVGVLGDRVRKDGLNLSGLINLLESQKDSILAASPQALAGALGLSNLGDLGGRVAGEATDVAKTGSHWLWALLVLLAVIAALWFLLRDCGGAMPGTALDTLAAKTEATAQKIEADGKKLGEFLKKSLPTNVDLNFPEFGIENALLAFIEDATKPVDKTTWFDFDRLVFESGSAALKPESDEQLKNIAEILKAFPNVKVKVGGYTDNVGDPAANMRLSQDRANNVMKQLISLGVAAERMAAEGYGEQHPLADNSETKGRELNRRIALRVTAK